MLVWPINKQRHTLACLECIFMSSPTLRIWLKYKDIRMLDWRSIYTDWRSIYAIYTAMVVRLQKPDVDLEISTDKRKEGYILYRVTKRSVDIPSSGKQGHTADDASYWDDVMWEQTHTWVALHSRSDHAYISWLSASRRVMTGKQCCVQTQMVEYICGAFTDINGWRHGVYWPLYVTLNCGSVNRCYGECCFRSVDSEQQGQAICVSILYKERHASISWMWLLLSP